MHTTRQQLLIIDDDAATRETVRLLLAAHPQWMIAEAARGQLGVEMAKRLQPRVLLLDITLPDLEVTEVLQQLQHDILTMDIPVVLLLPTPPSPVEAPAMINGARLTKPLHSDQLLAAIQRVTTPTDEGTSHAA